MPFDIGAQVVRKVSAGQRGEVVAGPIERRGQVWYRVRFDGLAENVLEGDLLPAQTDDSFEHLLGEGRFGDEKSFSRLLTLAKINRPLRDTIYSYQASRTELHGYQYKPLLKFLKTPFRRILIADEVGLGKTIEAAYIFQEERARHSLERALIVCPASLRVKWQNEMYQRFGERFEILTAATARRRLSSRDTNDVQFQQMLGIVSYETARTEGVRELLEEFPPALDFLIVDEVHHCRNRETQNFHAVQLLVEDSDSVVFLSATPVHTGNANLFNIMNLLLPERFDVDAAFFDQLRANRHIVRAEALICRGTTRAIREARDELQLMEMDPVGRRVTEDPFYPIVMKALEDKRITSDSSMLIETQDMLSGLNLLGDVLSRTRKRDVQEGTAVRSAHSLTPPLSPYEQQVYDTLSEFIFRQYEKLYDSAIARFVLSGLQRQIASSLHAAVQHYRDAFQGDRLEDEDASRDSLEIEETDFELDAEPTGDDDRYSLKSDGEFRDIIAGISLERLRSEDSKYAELKSLLKQSGQAIVFAFYKRSLRYLQERLAEDGIRSVRIDGDVPTRPENPEEDERLRRICFFRDKKCKVMLSSQVGSEGLDFQFCDTIINWDLPWNPMVVEQRIGRIDRIGQKSEKIFIYSLVSEGTIEELILERLYQRIGIFQDAIGDLEPILGDAVKNLSSILLRRGLSKSEKEDQINRSANAVLRERGYLRALENDSAQLIGHDEVIREKVSRISQLGRYLTGKELEIFVAQFLASKFPACELYDVNGKRVEPGAPGPRLLRISGDLRQFIARQFTQTDAEGQRFSRLVRRDELKVAFASESALEHPDAELIHSHHPLVRMIVTHYKAQPSAVHRVNSLQVQSSVVPPGVYFYGWASIDEGGGYDDRLVRCEFLQIPELRPVANAEQSERLLHEMVINGRSWHEGWPNLSTEQYKELLDEVEDHVAAFVDEHREKRVREAEAHVVRQLQAIQASYQVKRERRERAIATAEAAGRSETAIRLQRDQIRKLESDLEMRKAKIEARRDVAVSFRVEGVGWVSVTA